MTWIDITHLGRPSTTRSCDHVSQTQPSYDTEGSHYDTDLLLLQARSGERTWRIVSTNLTSAELARMASIDITQLGRPSTTRSCEHALQEQQNYDTE